MRANVGGTFGGINSHTERQHVSLQSNNTTHALLFNTQDGEKLKFALITFIVRSASILEP